MQMPRYNQIFASLWAQLRLCPPYLAGFDSSTAMLRATAAYLGGDDFPGMGTLPTGLEPIATAI
ncbi:hypothetical protein [Umezakia ovalisporum]|uniref:Uncharacterized protein n=1 Tax=Umezakia ovalisporum FSS-62 TaxID=2971776 RepID=A0AA43H072_9CYAN|nr:hypothetical protein [Umezakia ovalisporum]MDH6064734.1 hypothetical protein [Umezakia ovalisporum FSS-62]MDH6076758.1 hypothetical protein [Umezakia ovalisporum FSS-45]